jgi:hypothetical protein
MKKGSFWLLPLFMLALGLVLAGCSDDPEDPTHTVEYRLSDGKILTFKGSGNSSVPKNGDSFTLVTADGSKTVTGTITVTDTIIVFNKGTVLNVVPPAVIQGAAGINISAGTITFDDEGKETIDETTAGPVTPITCRLSWGYWNGASYSYIRSQLAYYGVSIIEDGLDDAGYLAGSIATDVFNQIRNNSEQPFTASGILTNTFEELLDFEYQTIGLPDALKAAMAANKANLPLAGVFGESGGVAVFYVELN